MKFVFESDMKKGQCYMCPMCKEREIGHICAIDDCFVTAIEDPSECPLQEANEFVWHPYPKERPPKEGDYLTSYVEYGKEIMTTFHCFDDGEFQVKDILAWSYLPAPYREVSDDK